MYTQPELSLTFSLANLLDYLAWRMATLKSRSQSLAVRVHSLNLGFNRLVSQNTWWNICFLKQLKHIRRSRAKRVRNKKVPMKILEKRKGAASKLD